MGPSPSRRRFRRSHCAGLFRLGADYQGHQRLKQRVRAVASEIAGTMRSRHGHESSADILVQR
jgi:hypothetical protein